MKSVFPSLRDPSDSLFILAKAAAIVSNECQGPDVDSMGLLERDTHAYFVDSLGRVKLRPEGLPSTLHEEHVIIMAIITSWQHILSQGEMDEGWRALSEVDSLTFAKRSPMSPMARMAVACNARSQWKYKGHPEPESPQAKGLCLGSWALPRPSQNHLRHSELIDLMPWPGLRERMCWAPDRYLSNDCLQKVLGNFDMAWPENLAACYEFSPATKLLQFTPQFRQCIHDIGRWTLKQAFFDSYPELLGDIPVFEDRLTRQLQDCQALRVGWTLRQYEIATRKRIGRQASSAIEIATSTEHARAAEPVGRDI